MDCVFIVLTYLVAVLPGMLTAGHAASISNVVWNKSGRRQMSWTVGPLVATLCFAPIAIGMAVTYVRRILPELQHLQTNRTTRPATF